MSRILIVEKSTLVATDIAETVQQAFPGTDAVAVRNIEEAESTLNTQRDVDICIVSGSAARDRLARLAELLSAKNVRTVAITDEPSNVDLFGAETVRLSHPFTSDMLIHAVASVSRGVPDFAQRSTPE